MDHIGARQNYGSDANIWDMVESIPVENSKKEKYKTKGREQGRSEYGKEGIETYTTEAGTETELPNVILASPAAVTAVNLSTTTNPFSWSTTTPVPLNLTPT